MHFSGRSMLNVTEIAHTLGLLTVPDHILLRPQDIMQTAPDKVAVVVSGTQGEPMSALSRVAVDNHQAFVSEPGDTVALSSRIIPGNEKAIYRMMNHIARRGADLVYGTMSPPIHVSGHASAGRTETGVESGSTEVFPSDSWRVPATGEARPTGLSSAFRGSKGRVRARDRPDA